MLSAVTYRLARLSTPLWRPMVGRRALPMWAMLHHVGRRSGRTYSTPVQVREMGDQLVVAIPWPDRSQWVRNVVAAGGCTVTWKGKDRQTDSPVRIGPAEAAPAYNRVERFLIRRTGLENFLRLRLV
jgi:deazaflavin-dependent oxidoreductase (nitroreductase family)